MSNKNVYKSETTNETEENKKERILSIATKILVMCLIVVIALMLTNQPHTETVTVTGNAVQQATVTANNYLKLVTITSTLKFIYNALKEILIIAFLFFGIKFFRR